VGLTTAYLPIRLFLMAFQIDLSKYQSLYTPLAILVGCLVLAAAIFGTGGIRIGGSQEEAAGSPTVAGEEESTEETSYDQAILDRFAKCLTVKGAKLYAHKDCPHCQDQRALFGSAVQYLNQVECADGSGGWTQTCTKAISSLPEGEQGVPAWFFGDGSTVTGAQTLEALAKKTGCSLK
jgi:hypothetical protein